MDIKKWIGYEDMGRSMVYTFRDVVLCNLAFGHKGNDLPHLFSKRFDFRANPAFALIPTFAGDHVIPRNCWPLPSKLIQLEQSGGDPDAPNGLDWDHDLYIYHPIEPIKGTFLWNNKVKMLVIAKGSSRKA